MHYPIAIVTVKQLARLTGYSEAALRKKIHDQIFTEGIHYYRSPDGRIHFSLKEYESWVLNGRPE